MKYKLIAAFLLMALLISPLTYASNYFEALEAHIQGNYSKSLPIFRSLAERGDAAAQYDLGISYARGEGVLQNDVEAVRWYRAAAEQGFTLAQHNLGFMYENGRGIPQNYVDALRWYHAAAEQGFGLSQFSLGLMYANGLGVVQNYIQAHKWANIAASQGTTEAAELRSILTKRMTPVEIQEAQKLAQEWVNSR